jgi:NTP pyrophosphatase (non-canonical NTP hydrolase)
VAVSHRNAKERGFWPNHADNIMDYVRSYGLALHEGRTDAAFVIYDTLEKYCKDNVGPASPMVAMTGIALIMTELAEVAEVIRDGHDMAESWDGEHGKPEGAGSEFADIIVRVADQCGRSGIDLNAELVRKMRYNTTRPWRHGGKAV